MKSYKNTVFIPSSKSYLQRAIAMGILLNDGLSINGYYPSDDVEVALKMASNLGVEFVICGSKIVFKKSKITSKKISVIIGEAGLSTRMFAPILACLGIETKMNGVGSIMKRPQNMVVYALKEMGLKVSSNEGYLPIHFQGEVSNNFLEINASISSQLLTGLLIAFCVSGKGGEIKVYELKSIPYIDITIDLLNHFGYEVENRAYEIFKIKSNQKGIVRNYQVENDWSSAAFHAVAGAIGGKVILKNLNKNSKQGDVLIVDILKTAGANVNWLNEDLIVEKKDLIPFEVDLTHAPDLFPPLCVLALACSGISKMKGVERLKFKESKRGRVLQNEFKKLGGRIELIGNEMWIHGNTRLIGGIAHSNNDHRIAMALSISGLIADSEVHVVNKNAVNKSYPTFYDDFEKGVLINKKF